MRTIDDIIPPSKRASDSASPPPSKPPASRSRGRFPFGTLLVVIVIVAVSVGALYYFGGAVVKITPTVKSATVSASFTAIEGGALPFQVISADQTESTTVPSTGVQNTSSSASGAVTITNTGTSAQTLRATTRFASPTGLIFRIHTSVTVPAAKGGTPGSVKAILYADKPGSDYNLGPTSFTVPGFTGTAQFTQVTAKSTTAFAGGASGNEPIVAPSVANDARATLTQKLSGELSQTLASQVPSGYVLLPGAATTTYQALPNAASAQSGMADLKEQGTIRAVVFPTQALAQAIASSSLASDYQNEPVTLGDNTLTLSAPQIPSASDTSFTFSVNGSAKIIYVVNPSRIAAAVAGKSRKDAETALASYPEVNEAVLTLRPFWESTFPQDPSGIRVTVVPQN